MKPGWMVAHEREPRKAMPYWFFERSVRLTARSIRLSKESGNLMPLASKTFLL